MLGPRPIASAGATAQRRPTRCPTGKLCCPLNHHRVTSRLAAVVAPEKTALTATGHTALLHGLGSLGDVSPSHVPWLLRLAHIRSTTVGGDSQEALQEYARGLMTWRGALDEGLLPDDITIQHLIDAGEVYAAGHSVAELQWPQEPLRTMLLRALAKLGAAHFAQKYPSVKDALLKAVLETSVRFSKLMAGIEEEEAQRETDANGNVFKTARELIEEQAAQRAARSGRSQGHAPPPPPKPTAAPVPSAVVTSLPPDKRTAMELVKELYGKWAPPLDTLAKAGRAFEGLEALLGGAAFSLESGMWKRRGWGELDGLRQKLENLKELRDLVRSLGRGGGWGPLRRAPVQSLDLSGRAGLLRTVLEAQETRGLTRSGDISRLLPAEAAVLARGRRVRQAKLLFFARLAEKGLQTYERDGWTDFPTKVNPDRREIRPTADRGPILLCVDTSGSMRGPRESVAKALALECMRAAREQERGCYVFAFSGPQEVRELELNADMKSVENLLEFLEKVFNGGSDFNEPVKRCMDRLTNSKWANSDVLLVSDGELRQPGTDIMRKLSGAKDKLGLRVHGLIVGSPEKKKADPAVLRSLCTNYLPNGKVEVLVTEFSSWASVAADASLAFDWDDAEGNARRRLIGLAHERGRQAEMRRKRADMKAKGETPAGLGKNKKKH